jgi:hypothetical protein
MQTFAMRFLDVVKAKTFHHIYLYVCIFFHHVSATAGLFSVQVSFAICGTMGLCEENYCLHYKMYSFQSWQCY